MAVSLQDKTILITRPNYEPTTRYLYHWSKRITTMARGKGAKVLELTTKKVTRKEFEGRIAKMGPNYIHLNGHGSNSSVTGHNSEPILDEKNSHVAKDTIVYALSCDSAATLASHAVGNGVKAYIGYKREFYFAKNDRMSSKPLDDESARFFLHPAMKLSEELLKGKNAREAVDITKKAFDDSILKAANSEVQTGYSGYIKYLLWDKTFLVVEGDGAAKV
jgi:hypothetical protein